MPPGLTDQAVIAQRRDETLEQLISVARETGKWLQRSCCSGMAMERGQKLKDAVARYEATR